MQFSDYQKKSSLSFQPLDSSYLLNYVGYAWYSPLHRINAECCEYIKVFNMSHEVCGLLKLWLELKIELGVYQADCQAQNLTGRER